MQENEGESSTTMSKYHAISGSSSEAAQRFAADVVTPRKRATRHQDTPSIALLSDELNLILLSGRFVTNALH
jgi:hypothetical protein